MAIYIKNIYICKVKCTKTIKRCILLVTLMTMIGLSSCGRHQQRKGCILPDSVELRAGDIVFRLGGGLESHAVTIMDRNGDYSHVGIVIDTMGRKMIVHAVPGEPDFDGDPDRVKLDSVSKFFDSVYALNGAVVRSTDSLSAQRAAKAAMALCHRQILFDDAYDVSDTTKMYCTELVMFVYEKAGVKLVHTEPNHVELPMVSADVYYPSDVYQSKFLKPIYIF